VAAVGVGAVGAERGHFRGQIIVAIAVGYKDHSEVGSHGKRPGKQPQHHLRRRAGGHVKISWLAAQQQIAHAAAGEISLIACRAQLSHHGQGGIGYYIDYAGGIHFFRNIAYANGLEGFAASGDWNDQGAVVANNTFVNESKGAGLGSGGAFTTSNQGFWLVNNIFAHLQRFAFEVGQEAAIQGNVTIDANLYYLLGYEPWESFHLGILAGHVDGTGWRQLPTLADVQTLGWEARGAVGDPVFAGIDPSIINGRWQDFRLTTGSALAIDTGMTLPDSLLTLLAKFHMNAGQKGAALDRGAIELDPDNPGATFAFDVGPTDGSGTVEAPWDGEPVASDLKTKSKDAGCACSAPGAIESTRGNLAVWLGIVLIAARRRHKSVSR